MNSHLPFGAATASAVTSVLLRLVPPLQQSTGNLPAMLDLDRPASTSKTSNWQRRPPSSLATANSAFFQVLGERGMSLLVTQYNFFHALYHGGHLGVDYSRRAGSRYE